MEYFKIEMIELKDDDLSKELETLQKIIQFKSWKLISYQSGHQSFDLNTNSYPSGVCEIKGIMKKHLLL